MKNTLIYKHKTTYGTVFLKGRKNGFNPESLYLEVYLKETQKRHLEFLGLYFTGNPLLDVGIKQDAIGKCFNYRFTEKKDGLSSFTAFCEGEICKIDKPQSRISPRCSLQKFRQFAKREDIPYSFINERYLLAFREWLLNEALNDCRKIEDGTEYKKMERGTCDTYLSVIMRYANRAQRKGYISLIAYNHKDIPAIGKVNKVPITLTEDEIIRLQSTPYPKEEICKALMLQFACGQRWGDIRDMTWEQILFEDGQYKIVLKQEKTDKVLPTFISKDLMNWVGEGKERNGRIFTQIPLDSQTVREHLSIWCKSAGINKKVGTHTMRRSCATILYKKGVELLTISKILGHSSMDITRRYIGIDEKDIKKGLDMLKEVTNRFDFRKVS